jgi:hypothetical protein
MRVFKYRYFKKWADHEDIADEALLKAVNEINAGLFDANLGGGLYKKRIPRQGQGKRGGHRVLLAFKQDKHIFFLYGFAKNQQENVDDDQRGAYFKLSKYLLSVDDQEIKRLLKINELEEVLYEN